VPRVNSKTQAPNHKPARPAGGKISNTKIKKTKNYVVHSNYVVIPTTKEEESPALNDRITFCLQRQADSWEIPARTERYVRAVLSRTSFGMTLGLARGVTSTMHPATSNQIILKFSNLHSSPSTFITLYFPLHSFC